MKDLDKKLNKGLEEKLEEKLENNLEKNLKNTEDQSMYYLEKAPVNKAIAHMAIPMILAMIVNVIYNITDAYFIGRLNNTFALSAITLVMPFTTIMMAVGDLFGVGGSTYVSRLLGEKDIEKAKKVSAVTFYYALISGVVLMIITIPFMTLIINFIGATGDTYIYTKQYALIYAIGSPFIIGNFALSQTVRAEGAAIESFIGMCISVFVNIVLDPLFIFTLNMGVAGASLATVVGNIFAVIYYIYFIKRKSTVQSVSFEDFKPSKEITINILKIGVSAFLLAMFLIISGLIFNKYAVIYGDYVVASFGIANRICQISDFIGMGLYMGVVPLIAYAYASDNIKRLYSVLKTTVVYLVTITLGIAIVVYVFRVQTFELFSTDNLVIEVGVEVLTALLTATVFAGIGGFLTSIFQAFGKGVQANIMSVARGVLLIPIIVILNHYYKLDGVIWSLPISEALACLVGLVLWLVSKKGIFEVEVSERKMFEE